jgi:hypothetical protein
LPGHSDYLFFVATRTSLQTGVSGLTVLTGRSGPTNGHWTLDFAPDFGLYHPNNPPGQQNGQIFLSAMAHDLCPESTYSPDATFDLNYAAPGTVFVDPTSGSGRLAQLGFTPPLTRPVTTFPIRISGVRRSRSTVHGVCSSPKTTTAIQSHAAPLTDGTRRSCHLTTSPAISQSRGLSFTLTAAKTIRRLDGFQRGRLRLQPTESDGMSRAMP